jgi:hypothetical protein
MKTILVMLLLTLGTLCAVGCANQPTKDQWVLQSYDATKGYVFFRNGVEYQTTCFAEGYPVLGVPPNVTPDLSPDAMPPNLPRSESACGSILSYLGKPVPKLRQSDSVFVFIEENNYRLEFEIQHAGAR